MAGFRHFKNIQDNIQNNIQDELNSVQFHGIKKVNLIPCNSTEIKSEPTAFTFYLSASSFLTIAPFQYKMMQKEKEADKAKRGGGDEKF